MKYVKYNIAYEKVVIGAGVDRFTKKHLSICFKNIANLSEERYNEFIAKLDKGYEGKVIFEKNELEKTFELAFTLDNSTMLYQVQNILLEWVTL